MPKTKLFNLGISLFMTMPIMNLFKIESSDLGILELHVIDSTFHKLGHVYLRYTNLSSDKWNYIGYDKVGPNLSMTIGRWGKGSSGSQSSSTSGFNGVHYNREEFVYPRITDMKNDIYVYTIIDNIDELNTLSLKIADLNDGYDSVFYNCAHFAHDVWNEVAEENEKLDKNYPAPAWVSDYLLNTSHLDVFQEDFNDYNANYYTYYEEGTRYTSQEI